MTQQHHLESIRCFDICWPKIAIIVYVDLSKVSVSVLFWCGSVFESPCLYVYDMTSFVGVILYRDTRIVFLDIIFVSKSVLACVRGM